MATIRLGVATTTPASTYRSSPSAAARRTARSAPERAWRISLRRSRMGWACRRGRTERAGFRKTDHRHCEERSDEAIQGQLTGPSSVAFALAPATYIMYIYLGRSRDEVVVDH